MSFHLLLKGIAVSGIRRILYTGLGLLAATACHLQSAQAQNPKQQQLIMEQAADDQVIEQIQNLIGAYQVRGIRPEDDMVLRTLLDKSIHLQRKCNQRARDYWDQMAIKLPLSKPLDAMQLADLKRLQGAFSRSAPLPEEKSVTEQHQKLEKESVAAGALAAAGVQPGAPLTEAQITVLKSIELNFADTAAGLEATHLLNVHIQNELAVQAKAVPAILTDLQAAQQRLDEAYERYREVRNKWDLRTTL